MRPPTQPNPTPPLFPFEKRQHMCPFFMYFRSSLEQSCDEVEQIDPPPEDTKKTKKKKEKKVVCVCVHRSAIATQPQTAPLSFLHVMTPCRRNSRCCPEEEAEGDGASLRVKR